MLIVLPMVPHQAALSQLFASLRRLGRACGLSKCANSPKFHVDPSGQRHL